MLRKLLTGKMPEADKILDTIETMIIHSGYEIVDKDTAKPWGAYFRISNDQASEFINEFFPEMTTREVRFGSDTTEISPKILVVYPHHRLSWQYHNRRAERWVFLTEGAYHRSNSDDIGLINIAPTDTVVQFSATERHRLVGGHTKPTVVAEIWQHTDTLASDEEDIIRVQDDYSR